MRHPLLVIEALPVSIYYSADIAWLRHFGVRQDISESIAQIARSSNAVHHGQDALQYLERLGVILRVVDYAKGAVRSIHDKCIRPRFRIRIGRIAPGIAQPSPSFELILLPDRRADIFELRGEI